MPFASTRSPTRWAWQDGVLPMGGLNLDIEDTSALDNNNLDNMDGTYIVRAHTVIDQSRDNGVMSVDVPTEDPHGAASQTWCPRTQSLHRHKALSSKDA